VIKFIAAAVWICIATLGAVFYAFQTSEAKTEAADAGTSLGGLDYIKADVISVPMLTKDGVDGYFLARLVYTVEAERAKTMSIPAESLIADQVYTYLYANKQIDFSERQNFDLDEFRNGIRDSINKRVDEELIREVIVEQIDFLSKAEIRDDTVRQRDAAPAAEATAQPKSH
jgi:flagellar basal body-associated protein FliL